MDIEYGIWTASIEVRQSGREIHGSFPYGTTATRADRGTIRKERFNAGSFSYALNDPTREINLLAGHSFDRPIASKLDGSLKFTDTATALTFVAQLPEEALQPSWVRDAVLAVGAGLTLGLSPGFSVPPASVVPDAEELIPEEGNEAVLIRSLNAVVLHEFSLVSRPSYKEATVELRAEDFTSEKVSPTLTDPYEVYRWL